MTRARVQEDPGFPRWERGYRTWGLWASASERLGAVGLGPHPATAQTHGWGVTIDRPDQTPPERYQDVEEARRVVEALLGLADPAPMYRPRRA